MRLGRDLFNPFSYRVDRHALIASSINFQIYDTPAMMRTPQSEDRTPSLSPSNIKPKKVKREKIETSATPKKDVPPSKSTKKTTPKKDKEKGKHDSWAGQRRLNLFEAYCVCSTVNWEEIAQKASRVSQL